MESPGHNSEVELSLVIPAFNESSCIEASLDKIVNYLVARCSRFEILVVDDGSTDNTVALVNQFHHPSVRCLLNSKNSGKGFSVKKGVLAANYDVVLFSDADLSTPIEEADRLLEAILSGSDIAIGSRWVYPNQDVKRSLLRKVQGKGFAFLVRLTTLGGFRDTQCGFKSFRRAIAHEIFKHQRIHGWGFDVEVLFIAQKWRLKVQEVPVRWYQSKGSKVNLGAPFAMLRDLLRIRWNDLLGRYPKPGESSDDDSPVAPSV